LAEYYSQAGTLDQVIRGIIGMDAQAVHERFEAFVHAHPEISSHANKFLQLLQQHIANYGSIEINELYEPPFTSLHCEGPDGLFEAPLVDELLDIIETFQSQGRY
jgi:type I restriction enzyme R subunit